MPIDVLNIGAAHHRQKWSSDSPVESRRGRSPAPSGSCTDSKNNDERRQRSNPLAKTSIMRRKCGADARAGSKPWQWNYVLVMDAIFCSVLEPLSYSAWMVSWVSRTAFQAITGIAALCLGPLGEDMHEACTPLRSCSRSRPSKRQVRWADLKPGPFWSLCLLLRMPSELLILLLSICVDINNYSFEQFINRLMVPVLFSRLLRIRVA